MSLMYPSVRRIFRNRQANRDQGPAAVLGPDRPVSRCFRRQLCGFETLHFHYAAMAHISHHSFQDYLAQSVCEVTTCR